MPKGLDCGTGNYVAASPDKVKIQRNAFLSVDQNPTTKKSLKRLRIPYVELNGKLNIVGKHAYEYAQIFGNQDLKRPMAKGLLNPAEQNALPILKVIMSELLGTPQKENEAVVYCVPGAPIDEENLVDYHEDVLKQLIESLGYTARPINEADALAYTGLIDDNLTGIAISMGAGMCNISIMYAGMPAMNFAVSRGGDFIDENVARDCGISKAKAQYAKETGGVNIGKPKVVIEGGVPKITHEEILTREQQAVKTYYGVLIRYILANIAKQFEESDSMPNFPDAIPIVIGGGTSLISGFIDVFQEQFNQKEFPIEVGDVRLVDEPLTAVARGCLADALLEEEE
ncbi:MAG: cell division FtsA domain-containing protein [Rhodobacteraceae bacterium]|nr:cell division FtsA domain-containing protein [Paracoccaceae bacterium]